MKSKTFYVAAGFACAVLSLILMAAVPSQTDFSGTYFATNALPMSLRGPLTNWAKLSTNQVGVLNMGAGLVKTDAGGVVSAAASGTDYAPATSGTAILKGNGSGGFSSAASGTDYAPATSGTSILKGNGSGGFSNASAGTDYLGMSGGTLTGAIAAPAFDFTTPGTLTPVDAGVSIDFGTATRWNSITLTGAVTFASANLAAGKRYELKISNAQATNCAYTWPANWVFVGIKPSYQTAGKSARLSLESWSTTDANVIAAYGEQQ